MSERKGRRKTGEAQKTRQPFLIDRLPLEVQEMILLLHNARGKSLQAIEEMSAEPIAKGKLGFVEWDKLDTEVLELFPQRKIAKSSLQRWIDVRFRQAKEEMQVRSAQAREIAEAFAASVVEDDKDAVISAVRDQLMALAAEDHSAGNRARTSKLLLGLAEIMQSARANDIKERKVAADERKIVLLENREKHAIQKLEAEAERLVKKANNGQPITAEDLADIRKKTFGF